MLDMKTSMKVFIPILTIVLIGCQETATHLTVNKDGSGSIVIREFFSSQVMGMLGSVEQMAQSMGDATDTPQESDELNFFDSMVQKQAEKMGPGVRLVKKENKKNENGWEGFEATYAFEDINKIRLGIGMTEAEDASTSLKSKGGTAYTFKFKQGDTANLQIIPQQEKTTPEEEEPESTQMKADNDAMMEMMSSMLKGFRMTFTVSVKGKIQDTNAKHRSQKQPNTITVLDLPFDKLLADSETRKIMFSTEDPNEAMAKLKEAGISDFLFEEPDKTIAIQFK
jgi:hypothetical protein